MNVWEVVQGASIVLLTLLFFCVAMYAGSLRVEINSLQVAVFKLQSEKKQVKKRRR